MEISADEFIERITKKEGFNSNKQKKKIDSTVVESIFGSATNVRL